MIKNPLLFLIYYKTANYPLNEESIIFSVVLSKGIYRKFIDLYRKSIIIMTIN